MEKFIFKAHVNEETGAVQTVAEHCRNTAELAMGFSIGELKEVNYVAALLHDLGKFQYAFQERINGKNVKVEHSTCGAIVARDYYNGAAGLLIQLCIAGHHAGIPDCNGIEDGSLQARLEREFEDYSAYKQELSIPEINEKAFVNFLVKDCFDYMGIPDQKKLIDKYAFLVRYVFSCLTDADSLDTEQFCTDRTRKPLKTDFGKCLEKVNKCLESFFIETKLQESRAFLQKQVYDKVGCDAEIYLMNMPTGSGKTLCSIKFALERAIIQKKKRIIYIIPYNSIIDQTAEVFGNLFGEDAQILRHQSTFSVEDEKGQKSDEDYIKIVKQVTENWDADFIITTAVQFFESVYSAKRGKLRKLHNMGDSILVFDEIHMMPMDYLQPCLEAITCITKYLNSEAIFLTATMPDFFKLFQKYSFSNEKILNLIEDKSDFPVFQKCHFVNLGVQNMENILLKAREYPTSLIVVNKRKTAREFYEMSKGKKYHLSTYMTAYDRKKVITEIHKELYRLESDYPGLENVPEERRITVVSTSLIEAGVDLDFFAVFRELAGVDNILQTAGRCNREGKRKDALACIFELDSEAKTIKRNESDKRAEITRGILQEYSDLYAPEAVKAYYQRLFKRRERDVVKNAMYQYCESIFTIPFREYAEHFGLIDSRTISIVVECDETSKKLIDILRFTGCGNARKLQKYACSVQLWEFEDLFKQGIVDDFCSGIYCLTNLDYYDRNLGIKFEGNDYFV